MMNSLVLMNGQWQGGADIVTLDGAKEIEKLYLSDTNYICVPVSESAESLAGACDIIGYDAVHAQTKAALSLLRNENADYVFTVGGGCDADIASILYANERYDSDLVVLWMDAHGDINAPSSSGTHLFYGMPIRALLGDCGKSFLDIINKPLIPDQFIHFGGRDIEPEEKAFMDAERISVFPVMNSDKLSDVILTAIQKTGKRHLYIHLDLDVLDPAEFPYTPVPVAGGLQAERLLPFLSDLRRESSLVGVGLFEYKPCGKKIDFVSKIINFGLGR